MVALLQLGLVVIAMWRCRGEVEGYSLSVVGRGGFVKTKEGRTETEKSESAQRERERKREPSPTRSRKERKREMKMERD
jgi:hypothetical protein